MQKFLNSQITPRTTDENKNFKVYNIIILLDSDACASIAHRDVLHKHHQILKDDKKKWCTMKGTFDTTFIMKLTFNSWNYITSQNFMCI